jgi:hypothetical protein
MAQDGSEWSTLHSGEFTDCHITDFFFVWFPFYLQAVQIL